MKTKLRKFSAFSESLLPQEADYLVSKARFADSEKIEIFKQMILKAKRQNVSVTYNNEIDKRKYSYIMKWSENKLNEIDVDKNLKWILSIKQKILTDSISPQEEKEFLNYLKSYNTVAHFFQNHYQTAREYKSYLLIRMRYDDHSIVSQFLNEFKPHATKALEIHDNLYKATAEITNQYTLQDTETQYWEKYLYKIFKFKGVDGRNRYQAFILLAFLYSNYNKLDELKKIFDDIDILFGQGIFYSKRFLFNYYASRVLMHSRKNELDLAIYLGYLSIRRKTADTLMYVNNLAANLLKINRPKESLILLESYDDNFNNSNNFHHKTGFISYKMRTLQAVNRHDKAIQIAESYLDKFKVEIMRNRWHHFFTSYFNLLIFKEDYNKLLKITSKFNLKKLENTRRENSKYYIPNISWSISLSEYMEGRLSSNALLNEIEAVLINQEPTESQKIILTEVINNLSQNLPDAFLRLKSHL